jgi:hypothetical protein
MVRNDMNTAFPVGEKDTLPEGKEQTWAKNKIPLNQPQSQLKQLLCPYFRVFPLSLNTI